MIGIYDDKVEQIDLKGQLKPFNINQLNRVMHILGQRRLGFDTSSIPTNEIPEESQMGQSSNRMEYPSTPKQFNLFQEYKNVEYDGNMLTGPRLSLRWPKHFIFFPGAFSSTRRWQSSIISATINT